MIVSVPINSTKPSQSVRAAGWQWLPMMASPFVVAVIFKIFPVDRELVGGGVFLLLAAYALFGWRVGQKHQGRIPLFAGFSLLFLLFSAPFWAMKIGEGNKTTESISPVFSYSEAKANPAAFAAWWKFFVVEVVRTNKVIFEPDPEGKPDYQGIIPKRPIPGATTDFHHGRISINSQGYRGDDFSREKGDIFRILTVGDSATFGQTLFRDSRTWSAVLQDLISRNLKCSRAVQVVNGGVNGYHLENAIDRIERDFGWLKPDMILSYFGWNSLADMGVYPTPAPLPTVPSETEGRIARVTWFVRKAMASLLNEVLTSMMRIVSLGDEGKSNAALMESARNGPLYRQYQQLIAQSRRLKYSLVLLSFNTSVAPDAPEAAKVFYQDPWPGVRSIIKLAELHNLMIMELAKKEFGIYFVDTGDRLYGRYDEGLYLDVVHFTPKGDAVMAANVFRAIRPLLLGDRLLDCQPAR